MTGKAGKRGKALQSSTYLENGKMPVFELLVRLEQRAVTVNEYVHIVTPVFGFQELQGAQSGRALQCKHGSSASMNEGRRQGMRRQECGWDQAHQTHLIKRINPDLLHGRRTPLHARRGRWGTAVLFRPAPAPVLAVHEALQT